MNESKGHSSLKTLLGPFLLSYICMQDADGARYCMRIFRIVYREKLRES